MQTVHQQGSEHLSVESTLLVKKGVVDPMVIENRQTIQALPFIYSAIKINSGGGFQPLYVWVRTLPCIFLKLFSTLIKVTIAEFWSSKFDYI